MTQDNRFNRREAMGLLAGAAGAVVATVGSGRPVRAEEEKSTPGGQLKHSVCYWCYQSKLTLDELAKAAAEMGMHSVELLNEDQWPVVKAHGLTCAMANGPGGIGMGWNDLKLHDKLVAKSEELLPKIKEAGLPSMIVFSGNRRGLADDEGLRNCATGLKRIMPLAEELGVNVMMELLNSKRDHADYQCDKTPWGANLVNEIGSDRFRLLYDIYHMQIMEGDVIATIQENIKAIGHFHTGGVPGRHEIDDTQELNYRRICQAIIETGFEGYLAQEFIPARKDPIASLKQGIEICSV